MADRNDVIVVGGGVIGLSIGWRAAKLGLRVTVLDDKPGRGASWASAGMLAPISEAHYGEEALLRLNLAGRAAYPSFVHELEAAADQSVGYRECGTLVMGFDADDGAAITEMLQFHQKLGLHSQRITARDCRTLEPMLAPGVRGGILVNDDYQIDNRQLVAALLTAGERAGVVLEHQRATDIVINNGQVDGVALSDGTMLPARTVVIAAGCWSGSIGGLPSDLTQLVRPVKGQILRLRGSATHPLLHRNVRALVRGTDVYLVPRADGTMVVGATVEEQGFDVRVTAGGVYQLLRDASRLVPGIDELEFMEALAALRPGSRDNAPLIGPTDVEGLVLATGHYRNGVLLTPLTANAVASLLTTGVTPDVVASFSPRRFARQEAAAC